MVRWLRLLAVSAAVVWLGVWSGAGNILDSRAQESGVYHKSQIYDKAQNRKNARRLFDGAGLMTSEEAGALEERIAQCRKKTGMDVAVVTAYNDGSHTAREYADDFYDQNGLGTGRKASGVLFLIYMDSPGSYGGESYVSTTGNMIRILTDRRIEQIQDDVAYSLRNLDYAGAAAEFLKDVEYYVDRGIQRGQYNYDTETGEISIYRSIRWYEGMFALLVSAGVAGSVCLGVKRRYSMEQTERERANSLLAYRADTKFAFGDSGDNLIRKFITSVPIPRPTQNHSPGGSGQSSGRSSTHRSSSGRSHGGGGRRF
jgi:uncharacterized protein